MKLYKHYLKHRATDPERRDLYVLLLNSALEKFGNIDEDLISLGMKNVFSWLWNMHPSFVSDCNYWGLGVAEYRDWLFEQIESSMKPMICSDAINSLYESCDEMKEDIKMYLSMKIRHDLQIADAEIRHFSNDIYATPNTNRRKKHQRVLMNRLSESASWN